MMGEDTQNQPEWVERLFTCIQENWQHHVPCLHINMQAFWNAEHQAWQVKAAPVFQEVRGGESDGMKVWSGFLFDLGDFGRSPGVWIQEQAVASSCNHCTAYPKLLVKGRFEGHPFILHILLEPPADTEVVEVVDTLRQEVREPRTLRQDGE